MNTGNKRGLLIFEVLKKKSKVQKIGTLTGLTIVVANMIGTGAFTSLGFQLQQLSNTNTVLFLWILGGVLALSGAFSYAELGTCIKVSGGEYAYLTKIYGALAGYLSGWISITVGFAAPVALSCIAFTEYLPVNGLNPRWTGVALAGLLTFIHSKNLRVSSQFQNLSTFLKVGFIVILIVPGLIRPSQNVILTESGFINEIISPAFAIALIYVSYSYSGWNAAAYISGEFTNPSKSLPAALIGGTVLVTVLYTLLQYVFLKHVPVSELKGQLNVGTLAAQKIIGKQAGAIFSLAISLLLVSGISAMVWVGPRVTASMAREHSLWKYFRTDEGEIPEKALWLQFVVTASLLLSGTFEQILIYCGVLLTLSSMTAVFGTFILRKQKDTLYIYKSPLFPLFQILFTGLSLWMILYAFINNPFETLAGTLNLFLGWLTYSLSK